MIALLNPWLWLTVIALMVGSGFTGYRQGYKATKAEYEAAAREAMTAMIVRHNELAKADADAAIAVEKKRQERRIKNLEARHELELEAARNHRPECSWSERERGLLNDLVDGANGKAPAASSVSDGLRQPAAPAGSDRQGSKGVGWFGRFKFW